MAEVHGYVCSHVFDASRPILLVAREEGDLMFLCGFGHGPEEQYHLVGINHLVARDPSVGEVLHLDDGFEAKRDREGAEWTVSPLSPEP